MATIKHRPRRLPILSTILLAALSFGCAGPTQTIAPTVEIPTAAPTMTAAEKEGTAEEEDLPTLDELEEPDAYQEIGLCDLNADLVGNPLRVAGQITFLDKANPQGTYFDLERDGCQLGVWINKNAYQTLDPNQQDLLAMGNELHVQGTLRMHAEDYILDLYSLGAYTPESLQLDPSEEWWTHPQTYHDGEGPDADFTPLMNITVLHDWSSLLWGFAPEPEPYWEEEAIQARWEEAHQRGMRVEAVLSIVDMFFVKYSPEDEVYESSAINLFGEHIQYADPEGFVGCTNQHGWQDFTRDKIFKAIDWGVDGIIIDDYEGSGRWTSGVPVGTLGTENGPGGCFCSACEAGFRAYLNEIYTGEELAAFGITDIDSFDYSEYLLERGWTPEKLGAESTKFSGWNPDAEINVPLYREYADFQNREVVEFLEDLKQESISYAREEYNKEISWSVNAGELTYGAHTFYERFDRNIGGIRLFGYPPQGTEGYLYRLDYQIFGNPRLRMMPMEDRIFLAVMNTYETHNLWTLKGAEAYANRGALIEYDYFALEGSGLEEESSVVENDPQSKKQYNTFYLDHADLFDYQNTHSAAKLAVLYSSPSVHWDMYRHTASFWGICEILTDLHVQFDPLFIGDGMAYPDKLNAETLQPYEAVILPHVVALTENQANTLVDFLKSGGTVIGLGGFGEMDENGEPYSHQALQALKTDPGALEKEGQFFHLNYMVSRVEGIVDEDFHDPAAMYYTYYIENNHPAVEEFLYLIEEPPKPHISDAAAAEIRAEFADLVDQALPSRVVLDTLSENIGVQTYQQADPAPKIILHLLNYNYELETDTVITQEEIQVAVEAPAGWDISRVSVISPDFEGEQDLDFVTEDGYLHFTVPELYIWDVVVIE